MVELLGIKECRGLTDDQIKLISSAYFEFLSTEQDQQSNR